jgi:ADP-heptose:LPS heptosyltransferase
MDLYAFMYFDGLAFDKTKSRCKKMSISFSSFLQEIKPASAFKEKLQLKLIFLWINICNLILTVVSRILYKNSNWTVSKANKILIFRTGSIGDTICSFPSIFAIKQQFPEANIDILTNAGSSKLVSMEGLLDNVYYNRIIDYLGMNPIQLWKQLRKNKYDLIIQLPQQFAPLKSQLRDIVFFRTAGIKRGFGWQKSSSLLFKKLQEKYLLQKNETEILLDIIHRNGIEISTDNQYPLNIKESDKLFVENDLRACGLDFNKTVVAIVIGAKRPQNRWPIAYFGEVIKYLTDRGVQIIIIGGKDDEINAMQLVQKNVCNICGKYTPMQSAVALSFCKLAISNDTGPMHLSYAAGIPVIAIFSSRDFPGRWYPPKHIKNAILRNNTVKCSMCLSETCMDNTCMKQIPAELIINQAKKILSLA